MKKVGFSKYALSKRAMTNRSVMRSVQVSYEMDENVHKVFEFTQTYWNQFIAYCLDSYRNAPYLAPVIQSVFSIPLMVYVLKVLAKKPIKI